MFTDPLVEAIHRLMPGLRTELAWTTWVVWALVAEAALLGTLAWMLVARLAQVLVEVWTSLTPEGRAAQTAERAALLAEVHAEVDAVMQALAQNHPHPHPHPHPRPGPP